MSSMTLYVERDSIIHKLDPLTKLIFVFVSIAITYIVPVNLFVLSVMIVSILLLVIGKVFKKFLPIIGLSMILIISIVIVQGFFHQDNETIMFSIGGLHFYEEGLSYAALLTMRVINMVSSFGVLILTTESDEMIERLTKKGMSPKIGYIILSVLQLIPQMRKTMGKITDAQRSRGMETEGRLMVRIKAFFPLIGPVVLSSLNDTRERTIALEMRGFNSSNKKSFLNDSKEYPYRKVYQYSLIIILLMAIVWRILS